MKDQAIDSEEKSGFTSQSVSGQWIQSGSRWWYRHSDGSYATSDWEYIDGKWYYFDSEGWMVTGWVEISNGEWVYVWRKHCLVNEKTPDGYFIDETGIWKE